MRSKTHKIWLVLGLVIALGAGGTSCKAIARAAAKYWSKKQIKKFVADCENRAAKLVGEGKAAHFCDCAVDKVSEKYHSFEDAKDISAIEIIQIAKGCK
jgi:hypothetical protein